MATVFGSGPANAIIGVGKEAKPYEFEPIVFEENGSTTQKKFKSAYMSPSFGYVAILHATTWNGTQEAYYCGSVYGIPDEKKTKRFELIEAPKHSNIVQSACGYYNVAYLTDMNEIYSKGEILGNNYNWMPLQIPTEVRIKEIHASFYALYAISDDDTLYEATTHTGNELKFVDHNVKQFGTGGYAYSYKKNGEYYVQKLASYTRNAAPFLVTINDETVVEAKLGWWTMFVKTASNKIFKASVTTEGATFSEIKLHPYVGKIRDFYVNIDELYLVGQNDKLYVQGTRTSGSIHSLRKDYPEMEEYKIDSQRNTLIGSHIHQIAGRYDGAYLILSKPTKTIDLQRILEKQGFIDLDIKVLL